MAREVAADPIPGLAAVRRSPEVLRRRVEDGRIDGRKEDGVRPLPPFNERARGFAREEPRVRADLAHLAGPAIEPGEKRPVVRARVEHVGILRVGSDVARFAAAGLIRIHDRASATTAPAAAEGRIAADA